MVHIRTYVEGCAQAPGKRRADQQRIAERLGITQVLANILGLGCCSALKTELD